MTPAQIWMTWCLVGMGALELVAIVGLRIARALLRRRTVRLLDAQLREAARQRLTVASDHRTERSSR